MSKRKQIYSITIDPDLVEKALKVADEMNFSQFVRKAIENYIKALENQKKECYNER